MRIDIDESVTPVAQHARRVPIALRRQVEERLNQLETAGIIEKVNEASAWVSPLVPVLKDTGEVRLCVDMRRANTAIRREDHPIPTMEDFLPQLCGAKWFSRVDVKDAFHQLELHESSRHITTFITHKGMYRYRRLMFGVSSASEIFQKVLEQILSKCERARNVIDDIIIWGETEEEHDQMLDQVLSTLKERGVFLNAAKCQFKVKKTVFLGD